MSADQPKDLSRPLQRVGSRYGELDIFGGADLISEFLVEYGEWGALEVEFLSQFVSRESSVFDVGSYLGTFSLGLHQQAEFRRCVAVEMNPVARECLAENLSRHLGCEHHVVLGAVGLDESHRRTEEGVCAVAEANNLGALRLSRIDESTPSVLLPVPTLTLAAIRSGFCEYDFLKLDVEGAELDVLRSDAEWIRERRPVLWLECNEDARALALVEFLQWAGYRIFYFAYPAFNTENHNGNPRRLLPCAFEAGLLGLREGVVPALSAALESKGCFVHPIADVSDLKRALWLTPRWGMEGWEETPRSQLIALLSRAVLGQSFETFLKSS